MEPLAITGEVQPLPAPQDITPAAPDVLKDVRLALNEAEGSGVPMPSLSVVHDRLMTGIARGYANLDWSALGLLASDEAGLTREPAKAKD